jgi:hypothetical protein
MKHALALLTLLVCSMACKTNQKVISIDSGGISSTTSTNPGELTNSGETFAYFSTTDGKAIRPSNIITYTTYRYIDEDETDDNSDVDTKGKKREKRIKEPRTKSPKEKTEKVKREKLPKEKWEKIKREKVAKAPRVKLSKEDKERKHKLAKEAAEKMRSENKKRQYADVSLTKAFYKKNLLNPITNLICIPLSVPTFGQSFKWMHPVNRKDVVLLRKCQTDNCTGAKNATQTKVLIDVATRIKRDEIRDSIVVVENLPESFKVNGYRIKKHSGGSDIRDVQYATQERNGKTYHQFTLLPKKGSFRHNANVWIILDVTITPTDQDLVANQ